MPTSYIFFPLSWRMRHFQLYANQKSMASLLKTDTKTKTFSCSLPHIMSCLHFPLVGPTPDFENECLKQIQLNKTICKSACAVQQSLEIELLWQDGRGGDKRLRTVYYLIIDSSGQMLPFHPFSTTQPPTHTHWHTNCCHHYLITGEC